MSTMGLVLADGFGWHHGDVGWGWMVVMMLGMLVFWGAVIVGVVWLIRGSAGHHGTRPDPEETLRQRLAEGSISVEEYEQRRAALSSTNGGDGASSRPEAGPATGGG